MLVRILAVAEDTQLLDLLERRLSGPDVFLSFTHQAEGLWERLAEESYDLLIVSEGAVPDLAEDVLGAIGDLPDRPEVVVIQEGDDAEDRAGLLSAGSLAVVARDLPEDTLAETLEALVERRRETLVELLRAEEAEESSLGDFASESAAMRELMRTARRVASSDTSLLILGETGVGKEWLARAIHSEGPRSPSPFVAVNCAAVPESLLESELFGHEKGAFTGAVRSRRGYFELAHRGTIFLDEIADMPGHLQAKLLRVLQDRSIQRLGGEKPIDVDVRVMASTNQDLDTAIADKTFRSDLYYRLGVVTLTVPPLRDRPEDIAVLVEEYREQFSHQLGRAVTDLDPKAMEALVNYSWPGNVRELINVLERAVLLCRGSKIGLTDLPLAIAQAAPPAASAPALMATDGLPFVLDDDLTDQPLREVRKAAVDAVEAAYLSRLLTQTKGQIGDTAQRAGIDPRSLYDKMKRLGLRKEDFKGRTGSGCESADGRRMARARSDQ